jgi:hypothetical protein
MLPLPVTATRAIRSASGAGWVALVGSLSLAATASASAPDETQLSAGPAPGSTAPPPVPALHPGTFELNAPGTPVAVVDGLFTPTPAGRGPDNQLSLGAIVDASIRAGLVVTRSTEVFLNLRYLGGGFRGESAQVRGLAADDTWTSNWLHTVTVSLGFGLR